MDNSLLKQILHEYELKRNKATVEADIRKKELLSVNPRLAEIEDELSSISIKTAKSILIANEKEKSKLINELKKQTNALIKEKTAFLKTISKDSRLS